jgi:peroxiredoxin (alkyl hydroperoxide reductase subunit C)
LSEVRGLCAVFACPRTGKPGQPPLVSDWDQIPGARGCTAQVCSFHDLYPQFKTLGCQVFGLCTQDTIYVFEMASRLHLPFLALSEWQMELTNALRLPTLNLPAKLC